MSGYYNKYKQLQMIDKFYFSTKKLTQTKTKSLRKTTLFKENSTSKLREIIITKNHKTVYKRYKKIKFYKQFTVTKFEFKIYYMTHFFNLFIKNGRRCYVNFVQRNLILLHKQAKSKIIFGLYKLIYLLQFALLLKGYRYKVGRGVIKHRYFLTPISILRQIFLSFFYFKSGLKKHQYGFFLNNFLLEFYKLIYFEENNSIYLINNLYDLAYQSRMFTAKQKKKRLKKKFKSKLRMAHYYSKINNN